MVRGGGMPGRASPGGSARPSADYAKNRARGDGAGRAAPGGSRLPAAKLGADSKSPRANLPSAPPPGLTWVGGDRPPDEMDEVSRKILAAQPASGTSIFDPVLCELAYRWFCPPAGKILDPFAGGSVRGIVASKLGRHYTGVELREEQVAANREQASAICGEPQPRWIVGDSRNIATLCHGEQADLLFSCPPYADLEVYSDNPADLSTLKYADFKAAYQGIIAESCKLLKPDRFACFVVGDARGKDGCYYGFPWHTVEAFQAAGLKLYNEAVLVTACGSLAIRIRAQWERARKLGKTHQNILVFVKGDPRKATDAIGLIEFGEIEAETAE